MSLKFCSYITSIASKPKAEHSLKTKSSQGHEVRSLYHFYSSKPKADDVIEYIASKPKAHNVMKFGPYITSIASKQKANNVITHKASKPKAHNVMKFGP